MGDRTCVTVIVQEQYCELVDDLIEKSGETIDRNDSETIIEYIDYEGNYGEINWLETLLEDNFIPYDKYWEAGSNYGPGCKHVRVHGSDPGNFQLDTKEYQNAEGSLDAGRLLKMFEQGNFNDVRTAVYNAVEAVRPLEPLEGVQLTPYHKWRRLLVRLPQAKALGAAARINGNVTTPVTCGGMHVLLEGYESGDASDMLMRAWHQGFDDPSLTEPKPEASDAEGR